MSPSPLWFSASDVKYTVAANLVRWTPLLPCSRFLKCSSKNLTYSPPPVCYCGLKFSIVKVIIPTIPVLVFNKTGLVSIRNNQEQFWFWSHVMTKDPITAGLNLDVPLQDTVASLPNNAKHIDTDLFLFFLYFLAVTQIDWHALKSRFSLGLPTGPPGQEPGW